VKSLYPDSVVRDIQKLATWFDHVYENNMQGLQESWARLVSAIEYSFMGVTILKNMETYKIVLPLSLSSHTLDSCITFCSNNSHPITLSGLSRRTSAVN
jgi:hypothetical protein